MTLIQGTIDQTGGARTRGSGKAQRYPASVRDVLIKAGPLAGREGILVRSKGQARVVLSIDLIQRSVAVDTDADALGPSGI